MHASQILLNPIGSIIAVGLRIMASVDSCMQAGEYSTNEIVSGGNYG